MIQIVAIFILSIFTGSLQGDLPSDTDKHPFEPCPGTPNCIIQSLQFDIPAEDLFAIAETVMNDISPFELQVKQEKLHIGAVFRIAIFGFKDDVNIAIESRNAESSYFHIKSASRVGHGDLGVNKRRVERITKRIKTEIQYN